MPRKSKSQCPVSALFAACVAFNDAQATLNEAIEKKSLSTEQLALYNMLRDGLSVRTNGHPTQKPRKENANHNKENGFENENADQAVADNNRLAANVQ